MVKMKYSHFYKVENKSKYKTAARHYHLARTKSGTYLFTDSDLGTAKIRSAANPEDVNYLEFEEESSAVIRRVIFVLSMFASLALGLVIGSFF